MQQKRVLTIAGTRPEAIKLAPLVRLLDQHQGLTHRFVATGQHGAMFHGVLSYFGLATDEDLALPNRSPEEHADAIGTALPALLRDFRPDLVLVQGDTTSAWASALTAAALGIPVGHVEAGLRSGHPDLPWPEERNRREIDHVSALLFAPSTTAAAHLSGLAGEVHVTGNTGIDALMEVSGHAPRRVHDPVRKLVLVTCHRREAVVHLPALAGAYRRIADRPEVDLVLPVHPNPAVGGPLRQLLADHPRIQLVDPLDYSDLVRLLTATHLLLTDSGGLQEEAPALGVPALILREVSERPEPIASGNARLIGFAPEAIVAETSHLLDDPAAHAAMSRPSFPYGRGDAAPRIMEVINRFLNLPAPTLTEPVQDDRHA